VLHLYPTILVYVSGPHFLHRPNSTNGKAHWPGWNGKMIVEDVIAQM
jgi:hypothetical protein